VSRDASTLPAVLARLAGSDDLVTIFSSTKVRVKDKQGVDKDESVLDDNETYKFRFSGNLTEKAHATDHWFQQWWKKHQPIEPILRRGLLEAFTLCDSHDCPLDSYWVCAGDQLEVAVTRREEQNAVVHVNLLILTPPPEDYIVEVHTDLEPISIARRNKDDFSIEYKDMKMIRKA
jgi:hypothetical protein